MKAVLAGILCGLGSVSLAQSSGQSAAETHHYAIEIAGIRVGTMTAVRQPLADNRSTYTLISDVKVKLLVYTVTVYYKANTHFEGKKLIFSTVEAHTNRGNYASRTEWKGDHYVISADQYKYKRQATERNPIDYVLSSLYFTEPIGRSKVFSEYFGDYFQLSQTQAGTYRALLGDREDEYVYERGRLVKVIKHNAIKNFVLRLLD
ncbi:hypothetical protein HNV11_02330 [Spirosoma taeanense]|uniref:DUF3108 domain-containing protein n=1 Tax=Spirosoma taeanense TaxID=2735870 RepID=A0A6M5Y4E9_9BACT|nr:DUF6134 family protein [Spirosoma taeanense]QJW88294.1 hypothetical protein HNV11_02330 [Spirosoma taeanense]